MCAIPGRVLPASLVSERGIDIPPALLSGAALLWLLRWKQKIMSDNLTSPLHLPSVPPGTIVLLFIRSDFLVPCYSYYFFNQS